MKFDKYEYELWLMNPVTSQLIEHFTVALKELNNNICDGNFLMNKNTDAKAIGFKVGYKDCIEHISYDILQQEESQDDTNISTFWSHGASETTKN